MQTKIWAISDNRAGHMSQITGVLEELKQSYKLFILNNNVLGKLNFKWLPLGSKSHEISIFKERIAENNIPDLLLVIGRRNLSVSLYLKKLIKPYNPKIKLVFLMPPGITAHQEIDCIVIHKYKMKPNQSYNNKILPIDFSPSKITAKSLTAASNSNNLQDVLNKSQKPYIGVIIGGAAKGVNWNKETITSFANSLNNLVSINGGSLLITTSRRTGYGAVNLLKQQLNFVPTLFWDYSEQADNLYLDILVKSDVLVVTGESTSMIADCIFINQTTPVLIFDDPYFVGHRFSKFHQFIYRNNYASSLLNGKVKLQQVTANKKVINTSSSIANYLAKLMANR